MKIDIVQLAKNYKEAQKALAKARKALVVAMDKDAQEASPINSKKAAPAKSKKAAPAKSNKAAIRVKPKRKSATDWAPYRATLLKKMKRGQWITGFDARLFSGHERGPGFTQNVLHHFLIKGVLRKRKVKTTTQWCLK